MVIDNISFVLQEHKMLTSPNARVHKTGFAPMEHS